jgi:hypothetical protein
MSSTSIARRPFRRPSCITPIARSTALIRAVGFDMDYTPTTTRESLKTAPTSTRGWRNANGWSSSWFGPIRDARLGIDRQLGNIVKASA